MAVPSELPSKFPSKFPSKIDWWMALILIGMPAATAIAAVLFALDGASEPLWWSVGSLVLLAVLYFGLVWPCHYVVGHDEVLVQSGLLKARIPIDDIVGIAPSRNVIGAPALSLDRLHIDHGKALQTYVSPADKAGFIAVVAERRPHFRVAGDRLVLDSDDD